MSYMINNFLLLNNNLIGLDPLDDDDEEELVISREDLLSNGMNSINSENLLILGEPSHFLNHKSSNILT